jgi:hypothetical protein
MVNLEANDNHIEVISTIADEHRIPAREEMWEAFQPKLYHLTVAAVWKTLSIQALPSRIRVAQLVSCTAGIVTLLVALRFLKRQAKISPKGRFLAFSLLDLNPGLIGISAQATNDAFVILFGSLSLDYGFRFFEKPRPWGFSWMTGSAILAGLAKGNGLVVGVAIMAVFLVAFLWRGSGSWLVRRQTALYGGIFLLSFLAVVPTVGPYWQHYQRYGSPFVLPILPAPFPKLFEKTYVYKPGVISIVDSFLNFRLVDLLMNPISTTDAERYPQHRTSLWSQLYGRAHFAHFDDWPPSWRLSTLTWPWTRSLVRNLGRLIFLCALFPTLLLLMAICGQLACIIRCLAQGKKPPARLEDYLMQFTVFGYLAFMVVYALRFRDYAVMKAIFLWPGLLGFLILFARECDAFYRRFADDKTVQLCADLLLLSLLCLYTADILMLIGHLGMQRLAA